MSAAAAQAQPSIDRVLGVLKNVKRTGQRAWVARCVFPEKHSNGDANPSLAISETADKAVLIHCLAGCNQQEVWNRVRELASNHSPVIALDKSEQKTFDVTQAQVDRYAAELPKNEALTKYLESRGISVKTAKQLRWGFAEWPFNGERKTALVIPHYQDAELVGFKARAIQEKRFSQAPGSSIDGLYAAGCLDEFAEEVLILEGCEDVALAIEHGFNAAGIIAAASKLSTADIENLGQYSRIYLIGDQDRAGQEAMDRLQKQLPSELVIRVGLSDFKDIGEIYNASPRQFVQRLRDFMHDAEAGRQKHATPVQQSEITGDANEFELTELGNAERLVARFGEDIRYSHEQKKWFEWTGKVWTRDRKGGARKRLEQIVEDILNEAANAQGERREALSRWGLQSQKDAVARGTLSWATSKVPVLTDDFDRSIYLLNLNNGTLNLQNGQFFVHRREDFITKIVPIDYEPAAKCPRWEQFLSEVMKDDRATIQFLQRAVGYSLTGFAGEHCLFLLHGTGRNGKSVFIKTIQHVLGDYAMQTDWQSFTVNKYGGVQIRNDIARLHGARFVAAIESEQNIRIAESLIKAVTGGDRITARFLYQESFEFIPQFKLWLATNHKPKIVGIDDAIWSRIKLIPFSVTIPSEKRDVHLSERLQEEASGILNWALKGLELYNATGLEEPHTVSGATADYRQSSDVLKHFLDSQCIFAKGASIGARELYQAYKRWSDETGEFYTMSERDFSTALEERGFARKRTIPGIQWYGLSLAENISLGSIQNAELTTPRGQGLPF